MRRKRRFRRDASFVAVRPLKIGRNLMVEAGEIIPAGMLRVFHLRKLWAGLRVGEVDDPWSEQALATWAAKVGVDKIVIRARDEVVAVVEPEPDPEPEPELVVELGDLKVFAVGSGWFSVRNLAGEEVEKLRGQANLTKWVEALQAPAVEPATEQ